MNADGSISVCGYAPNQNYLEVIRYDTNNHSFEVSSPVPRLGSSVFPPHQRSFSSSNRESHYNASQLKLLAQDDDISFLQVKRDID